MPQMAANIDKTNTTKLKMAKNSTVEYPLVQPTVGIGASAGGLKSIEKLFDNLPSDTGMTFVVIQHLSPDYKSLMTEILSRHTDMPIRIAEEGMMLVANHVYLIPPGKELRCVGKILTLTDFPEGLHRPIDAFFNSLSMNEGIVPIGIVLSGTGSDGADGLAAIHRSGGLTIAESVETAEFDGMPVSARRTGCVDHVLRPEEIPDVLQRYKSNSLKDFKLADEAESAGVRLIFSLLENQYGLQFEHYKPQTIARRIERRQKLGRFKNVFEYADCLSSDSKEVDDLFHDLLIGVTKFFRDAPAFASLEKQIEESIAGLADGETYRVWTAGCATGEESYSIAMIALDVLDSLGRKPLLKVFATDVHERTLEQASQGVFDADSMEFVSLERQQKYFERVETGLFRVNSTIRKHIVFARHDLIQDAPFTRINLVSCRNMLIYFQNTAQAASLTSLHFALVTGGLLFLGASETLGALDSEFHPLDQTWRIFRKIRDRRDLISQPVRMRQLPGVRPPPNLLNADKPVGLTVRSLLEIYEAVIHSRVPLGVLLDHNQNLVHAFGETEKILRGASGRFTGTIGDFIDQSARITITSVMIRAEKEPGTNYIVENVQPNSDSQEKFDVSVMALPATTSTGVGWILQFDETDRVPEKTVRVEGDPDTFEMLESELNFTKESLSSTVEELETSNEELQATNEEMVASNEELQSTNEELHSVNEELHSVNVEYQRKIDELEETTSDLETLLSSSEVGTIFLGSDLRIRKFTTAVTRYFNLIHHDFGRPLTDFTSRLGLNNLPGLLQKVMDSGDIYTTSCTDDYGDPAFVKIIPCKIGTTVSGVVLNVLNHSVALPDTRPLLGHGDVGTWEWPDVSRDEMWWSPACYEMLDIDRDTSPSFAGWKSMVHPDDIQQFPNAGSVSCRFVAVGQIIVRVRCGDGEYRSFEFRDLARNRKEGTVRGISGTVMSTELVAGIRSKELARIKHLEQTARDLQDYAYAVSHNLQSPLRQARQSVDQLKEELDTLQIELPSRAMENVSTRTRKLEDIIRCLLEYSRVNTKGKSIVPCSADEVLADVLDEFREYIETSGAMFTHSPLPDVLADKKQLRQVFWHIIDNALKYSDESRAPQILITSTMEKDRAVISFRDNGIGIELRHIIDVFIIFRRLQFKENVPGSGLGLALCKRIVERHGGKMWAKPNFQQEVTYEQGTTYEHGTTFSIRMPIADQAD